MDLIFKTELDEAGCIALPKEIISDLHLKPWTKFVVEQRSGEITLVPFEDEKQTPVIEKDGILVIPAQSAEAITDFVAKDREERISKIIGDSFK